MFQLRGSRSAFRPPNGPQNNIISDRKSLIMSGPRSLSNRTGEEERKRDEVGQDKRGKRMKERKNKRIKEK